MKGYAMLQSFIARHSLGSGFLEKTRDARIVSLRAELIRSMKADGLNNAEISRVMCIDRATVAYWLRDEIRQAKIVRRRVGHQRRKYHAWWEECAAALAEARA